MCLKTLVAMLCAATPLLTMAQTTSNHAYAITSKTNGAHEWTEVKQIDLTSGDITRNVFENNHGAYHLFDGRSLRPITVPTQIDSTKENQYHPFAGLSAACAYDAKQNRLYYAPLFLNQLRYIDLNQPVPSVYLFRDESLISGGDMEAEGSQITRMAFGADGNGYAINNEASHLVQFSTGKNPVINDLGAIHDAVENGDISIHDANTSWGGDLLADASGNLYVISANNHVFRIDIQTKLATFITRIKNLPVSFTTNGAVVDEEGNIVLSSANFLTAYYKVNPDSWEATAIQATKSVNNTSDLANERLLFQTKLAVVTDNRVKEKIAVYPNPVKSNVFRVSFDNKATGDYNIQLMDVSGRLVSDGAVSVFNNAQVSEVRLNGALTRGMYFVKVVNHQNREIYTKKIVLE